MDKEDLHFGNGVRLKRKAVGLTQGDLAEKAGIFAQQVSQIETGKRRASLDVQRAISRALNVSIDDIIEEGLSGISKQKEKKDDLPARLKKILETLNLDEKKLADKIDVTSKSVKMWLNSTSRPSIKNAMKIEAVTGYYHCWLMDDNFEGPSLLKAQWTYENRKIRVNHQEAAALYERIYEIIEQLKIDKNKLVKMAKIRERVYDDWYFLGQVPSVFNIKKIADATGYNPDWILNGLPPKKSTIPYATTEEKLLPNDIQRSPGEMSYSLTDDHLTGQKVKWVNIPVWEEHNDIMTKVKAILESGEIGTITALTNNVHEFHEKIMERKAAIQRELEHEWNDRRRDKELAALRNEMDLIKGSMDQKK